MTIALPCSPQKPDGAEFSPAFHAPHCFQSIFVMQTTQDRAPYNSLATPNSVTRNFQHRNFTATPPGLLQYWMGHAGEGMSELYGKIKGDVRFRKEVRFGFRASQRVFVQNPRYWTEWTETRKIPA